MGFRLRSLESERNTKKAVWRETKNGSCFIKSRIINILIYTLPTAIHWGHETVVSGGRSLSGIPVILENRRSQELTQSSAEFLRRNLGLL